MPLIIADAKSLEWVTACYLSGDKIGREELASGTDVHAVNQEALRLPSRNVAKVFLFRTIYCDETSGGAYGFSHDPEFTHVSSSTRYWQDRIDSFFTKYKGLAEWHAKLLSTVGDTGRLVMPWGREFPFYLKQNTRGDRVWPKTQIYNYPVQNLGAELMAIVRVSLMKRIKAAGLSALLVGTVHDSVLIDATSSEIDRTCQIIRGVFSDLPRNFEKLFGIPFDMTLNVEIKVGNNWGNAEVIN